MSAAPLNRRAGLSFAAALTILFGLAAPAKAGEVKVAAAANFTQAATEIGALFEQKTGHKAVFSFGSTGQLFTQIAKGAPFEVFLSADRERAAKAGTAGLARADTQFTYATGKIVLYSRDDKLISGPGTLKLAPFTKIAIANPAIAPYGAAAVTAMQKLGVYDNLKPRIVRGNSIAQTHQFVESGNAELGFVALSQIIGHDGGSRWPVAENLYSPIAQDAVLLTHGQDNPAARAFLIFLAGPEANRVKARLGYGTGEPSKIRPDA
ncbi:MAG: molybdate ABC transporter substrate-binding protein [Rhodospirillales bacterium]